MKTVLLISARERHAARIFAGEKRVELRRVRPRVVEGDLVVVYAPKPISALVGAFQVGGVVEACPSRLWELIGKESGVSLAEFKTYYRGAAHAFGILVEKTWRLEKHLSLPVIRKVWCEFYPPQGYKYLNRSEQQRLSTVLSRGKGSNGAYSLQIKLNTTKGSGSLLPVLSETLNPPKVVTAYRTGTITKYWKKS
ncbi:MAG: hypothetical protein C4293_11915 [Nitrospiraceae bacterium]